MWETVDLPVAREPVRPIRSIVLVDGGRWGGGLMGWWQR